ncbi:polysaccharide deacetylase family protein [Marinicrinis sediminis]|uniref:Polysaccharide deacetylase family protein n=1 Tax=Marinicrinis sediminis TaxID=1652465 RepID=A0ABW5RCX8_9BACL
MTKPNRFLLQFVILTALLLAAGCANQNAADPADLPANESTPTENAEDTSVNNDQQADNEQPADPTSDAQSDDADADPDKDTEADHEVVEPAPVKKMYYVNGIYDIKPMDDQTDGKVVLLTFDDGPKEQEMITSMLETLDKHEAKAIFFVNGFRVEQNPDLLKQLHEAGHAIGNHAWDHINLSKEDQATIYQQIEDVQTIVKDVTGEAPQFFRAPHGAKNEIVLQKVREEQMGYMNWSNGSLDWDRNHQTAPAVIQNVMEQLRSGSNILMHELPWTVEALDELLQQIKAEGYSFVDPFAIDPLYEQPDPA